MYDGQLYNDLAPDYGTIRVTIHSGSQTWMSINPLMLGLVLVVIAVLAGWWIISPGRGFPFPNEETFLLLCGRGAEGR